MEASDQTLGFIKEFGVKVSYESTMTKPALYADYVQWARNSGISPLAMSNFFVRLMTNLRVSNIDAGRESTGQRLRKVYIAYDFCEGLTNAELVAEYQGGHPFDKKVA